MKGKWLLMLAGALLLAGCETEMKSTAGAEGASGVFKRFDKFSVSTYRYYVDPPDELTVLAPDIKELNEKKQTVSADGTVTFNLIGQVPVQGKTPEEIADMLKNLTKKYYSNPDIKVVVTAQSKFFYIFGQGTQNGLKHPFTGRDNLLQAMADAGFNDGGWPEQVRLSRPAKNGKANETAVVDFMKIFNTGDMSQNYVLEEGDVIHVPFTPLMKFNEKVTRVVGPITGASAAASAVRPGGIVPVK